MIKLVWSDLQDAERQRALQRPPQLTGAGVAADVDRIIDQVRADGDNALMALTRRYDGVAVPQLRVAEDQLTAAEKGLSAELSAAVEQAAANIRSFHTATQIEPVRVETMPGVVCERQLRPLHTVGLYVPAGRAPLPSTVLMLAIPAGLAGCSRVVLCSPPGPEGKIDATTLAVARRFGVTDVFRVGGAQAVAAMAYGTASVPKCDKIFGPGNAWVTQAKQRVAQDPAGAAIDMPAGPSEVLVIADGKADPELVAIDLLSQAEHGPDSQVVLVTDSDDLAAAVEQALVEQMRTLSRDSICREALTHARIIITNNIAEATEVSNRYAPEHLIINTVDAREWLPKIRSAGSVFLGPWSPESMGDYCSGTNHVLPTYGYARTYSGVSVESFQTAMTVQELTPSGLQALGPTAQTLARAEGLDAHEQAVTLRLRKLGNSR